MEKEEMITKINKIIKDAKLQEIDRGDFKSFVVHLTLTDGKELDIRVKNYELQSLVQDAGIENFVISFDNRYSEEKGKNFDCFVISLPAIGYELLTFPSREVMAMLNLRILKK